MNDPVSDWLIGLQWLSLACRIKTHLSMVFKVFLDLPQPALPESLLYFRHTSIHLPANQDAIGVPPTPLVSPVQDFAGAIPSVQDTLPHLLI